MLKKIRLASIFVICLAFSGCKGSAKKYPVDLVDRNTMFAPDQKPAPLRLVVEIDENGKLSLNKIKTGTIADTTNLCEKIGAIFDDREKTGLVEKEVVIDPHGEVADEDLEKLIKSLAEAKAAPIRLIKTEE